AASSRYRGDRSGRSPARAGSSPRVREARPPPSAPPKCRATSGLPPAESPARTRSAPRNIDLRKRCLQAFGELPGIVIGPEMHEVEVWLIVEHVIVNRGDLDPLVTQRLQHRVHL